MAKELETKGFRRLQSYNARCYEEDLKRLLSFSSISESEREWIDFNREVLRSKANRYEVAFACYLIDHKVKFLHQCPFVIEGKKYFADFYIPSLHVIIELDGDYHNGYTQRKSDKKRDKAFKVARVKTIRIPNNVVLYKRELDIICRGILPKK